MRNDQLVSVIVTTKNEKNNIENCLTSIKNQTWEFIELIVIDNYSIDNTVEISKNYTEKVYTLGPERSAQRNYGMIKKSTGNYLMYVDADMILSPRLIEACIFEIKKQNFDALHIHEKILGLNIFSRARNFERSFYSGTVIDGARFFTKDIFLKSNGFDEAIFKAGSGEDWDLDKSIRKIGGRIGLLPEVTKLSENIRLNLCLQKTIESLGGFYSSDLTIIYHNESNIKFSDYLKKKMYYAKGFNGYVNKWGKGDLDIRRQLGWKYRFFFVFYENGKWKKILRHPVLFLAMYYLRVRLGIAFIYFNLKK
jgi:glycosyltransferase involved in cell wall biosynthesis